MLRKATLELPVAALFQPFPMLAARRAQAWRHRREFRRPRHFHEEPEINLVVRGSARLGIGDRDVVVGPGELSLFQPGQDHVLLEGSEDLELFVMALRPELAERALGTLVMSASSNATLAPGELDELAGLLHAVAETNDALAVERRIADSFALLLAKSAPSHFVTRRTLAYVRAEPELSGPSLARHARVSASTLSERFRRDLGVPLVEYRARVKLMRFVELVDRGASHIRAAVDAEFGSYAQCHRVFRRALGCSPRDYFRGERARIDGALADPTSGAPS